MRLLFIRFSDLFKFEIYDNYDELAAHGGGAYLDDRNDTFLLRLGLEDDAILNFSPIGSGQSKHPHDRQIPDAVIVLMVTEPVEVLSLSLSPCFLPLFTQLFQV